MADSPVRTTHGPNYIRVESSNFIAPAEVGAELRNVYPTTEGTLRAVWGPCPYSPDYGNGYPTFTGDLHGIGHFSFAKGRELLLIQWGDSIRVFRGWKAAGTTEEDVWEPILGPATATGGPPQTVAEIGADQRPRFPAQFERTPAGIVIIPRGSNSRPYFYDGTVILPLGYADTPSAPVGWGPETDGATVNVQGYHHDGGCVNPDFRQSRIGTVNSTGLVASESSGPGVVLGTLHRGLYQAAVQWIDRWGNLSAASPRSNALTIYSEAATVEAIEDLSLTVEDLLKQLAWCGIESGPTGTIGRVLLRSKDQYHAGTSALFEVPTNVGTGSLAFATIPDNDTDLFPDNVPDAWLLLEGQDIVPVEAFSLYKMAFGHGFAANYPEAPGLLRWTLPGRWGTFQRNDFLYPDPQGAAITGMHATAAGLLVFTAGSTFLLQETDTVPAGFKSTTIHSSLGCAAPNSIQTMPTGEVVWLSPTGFCAYTPVRGAFGGGTGDITVISQPIDRYVRDFNKARLVQATALVDPHTRKYMCWVAWQGASRNNMCWEYDGKGWRQRDDMADVSGCCVTDDHRQYLLAVGKATIHGGSPAKGVWVLDHQNSSWTPATRESVLETAWLRVRRSKQRGSPMEVFFWLRETESGTMSVEVHRDWRVSGAPETFVVQLHPTDDAPPFWGTAIWGGEDASGSPQAWPRRRPYWIRGSIFVPSVEVFKLRIVHEGDWEFVGMTFDEIPHGETMRVPR